MVVLAIGAVCAAAILDHRAKEASLQRAHVDQWVCEHRGERCDATSPSAVESAWNRREAAYGVAVVVLAAVGIIALRRPQSHRYGGSSHQSGE